MLGYCLLFGCACVHRFQTTTYDGAGYWFSLSKAVCTRLRMNTTGHWLVFFLCSDRWPERANWEIEFVHANITHYPYPWHCVLARASKSYIAHGSALKLSINWVLLEAKRNTTTTTHPETRFHHRPETPQILSQGPWTAGPPQVSVSLRSHICCFILQSHSFHTRTLLKGIRCKPATNKLRMGRVWLDPTPLTPESLLHALEIGYLQACARQGSSRREPTKLRTSTRHI